eukprot:TRINITY_DN16581_c0_g1_i1.p1 TRINITY_DN16581_c0_g1~~TRINITY_DN16581_c0_g1_i1.p1  ORF type:complete len:327 (+),score=106.73 TRINITY_DN16581_c0_g1_i1:111-983(+)
MSQPLSAAAQREVGALLLGESSRCPLLYILAEVLSSVAAKGDRMAAEAETPADPSSYTSAVPPGVSLRDYLRRWARYTRCGSLAAVGAVMYIDRVCLRTGLVVSSVNVHRLLLAALTVSAKWQADVPFLNSYYAQVGGVTCAELNQLERQLLEDLDWSLVITADTLETYTTMFRSHRNWHAAVVAQGQNAPTPPRVPLRPAPAPPAAEQARGASKELAAAPTDAGNAAAAAAAQAAVQLPAVVQRTETQAPLESVTHCGRMRSNRSLRGLPRRVADDVLPRQDSSRALRA